MCWSSPRWCWSRSGPASATACSSCSPACRTSPPSWRAALTDGASAWQRFRYVTLPQLRPALFFVAVIETTVAVQVFDMIYVMTGGGPVRASYSLVYLLYDQGFKYFDLGYASAIGVALSFVLAKDPREGRMTDTVAPPPVAVVAEAPAGGRRRPYRVGRPGRSWLVTRTVLLLIGAAITLFPFYAMVVLSFKPTARSPSPTACCPGRSPPRRTTRSSAPRACCAGCGTPSSTRWCR
ncbi:carbohydrate ABC transporter permease [Micromonospora coxensis]|uniref:carbohydrate ABC transporter permease n=1 Tax=Micromonospora coxensis TaxID=356852 RepID=UPI0018D4F2CC|nr:sugar ABC transporter permease [Micromonospora coxensis]